MNHFSRLFNWAFVIVMFFSALPLPADDSPIKVMSFNIRYGTAKDGENDWNHRRDFVIDTIKNFSPDLLGTQESLGFQRDEIAKQLPSYAVFGVGRDDGQEQGEMMVIYYRQARFDRLDGGHFWYSETPNVPGSKSWDTSLPRMATWLKLKDKSAGGKTVWYFNTHFDHRGTQARIQSATLLRQQVAEITQGGPVIITGDFNAPEGSEVHSRLFEGAEPVELIDTFRKRHPEQTDNVGTSGGFTLDSRGNRRIDWIGCSTHFDVDSAEIDRTNRNGVTPSDHFPVNAILSWK